MPGNVPGEPPSSASWHRRENTGEEELCLLDVFRPAGSPAEAYHPDGTLALVAGADC
jgi:hypothetical protein